KPVPIIGRPLAELDDSATPIVKPSTGTSARILYNPVARVRAQGNDFERNHARPPDQDYSHPESAAGATHSPIHILSHLIPCRYRSLGRRELDMPLVPCTFDERRHSYR